MTKMNLNPDDINNQLPDASADTPYLRMTRQFGSNFIYVSGMGPVMNGKQMYFGSIPGKTSIEDGILAARYCALNILASLKKEIGGLQKVKSVVKLLVFVSSDAGFSQQHIVANGASEVFIEAFGTEIGKSSRSAIGVAGLPMDFPVEVEAIFELKE